MLHASRISKRIMEGIMKAIKPKPQVEDVAFAPCIARAHRWTPPQKGKVNVYDASRNREKKKKKKKKGQDAIIKRGVNGPRTGRLLWEV